MKKRRGCCATAIAATARLSLCRKKSEACWGILLVRSKEHYAPGVLPGQPSSRSNPEMPGISTSTKIRSVTLVESS